MGNFFYGVLIASAVISIMVVFIKFITSVNEFDMAMQTEIMPWNEDLGMKTWNEIPVNLYPLKDDVPYGVWIKWAKEPTTICRLSSIQMYYEIGDEYPKLKKFIKYAAKSSNGIDNADCAAMVALAKEHDELEERKEFTKGVKELVKT